MSRLVRVGVKAPPDPGFAALRRAARAAIVIPLAFAFAELVLRELRWSAPAARYRLFERDIKNAAVSWSDELAPRSVMKGYSARSCEEGAREVRGQVRVLLDAYGGLADQLRLSRNIGPEFQVSTAALRQAELNCLRRWQTDPAVGRGAMAVVMAGEWAVNLARLEADLEGAASSAAQAARRPWWR